jgi:hypothetical protein
MISHASCGLIYGLSEHHLDHIAPLCALLDIPLCVTDPIIKNQTELFYPGLHIHYYPQHQIGFYLKNFHYVISALPKDLLDSIFFLSCAPNDLKPQTIWCPHGNSDKGKKSFFAEALRKESYAIVYGQTMLEFFSEKKALSPTCLVYKVGSYRFQFYKKHKAFYKKLYNSLVKGKLSPQNTTIFYAPTWADSEGYSSVDVFLEPLLKSKPNNFNLIVKLHPNSLIEADAKIQQLVCKYESLADILFLENFPPIYPILDNIDVYLGDSSSIGYDMLHFQKPMIFINIKGKDFDLPLFKVGKILYPKDIERLYPLIEEHCLHQKLYGTKQKKLCDKTFSKKPTMTMLEHFLKSTHRPFVSCAHFA